MLSEEIVAMRCLDFESEGEIEPAFEARAYARHLDVDVDIDFDILNEYCESSDFFSFKASKGQQLHTNFRET
jgi:hypothetical protein